MKSPRYVALEEIAVAYSRSRKSIRTRLKEFANVPADDVFYELVYCLLTPQSSAAHADSAVQLLREGEFHDHGFDPTDILRRPGAYIRFHNTKARRLLAVRTQFAAIDAALRAAPADGEGASTDGLQIREWLVRRVHGLGMKEASHFLRNIGYKNLAILDRHILRNLRYHGVLSSVPSSMTTRRYLDIETRFLSFAATVGIPMDDLDLLFWSKETGEIRK